MNHLPEGSIVAVAGAAIFLGKNPVVPEDQTLCPQLWDAGYSLSNVPGILALSLGGVLSMGADGDAAHHSIFDNVLGFRFVDGNGSRHTAWRNDTDTDLFYGGLVSMGLLGVVYEYVLVVEPRFCTEEMLPFVEEEIRVSSLSPHLGSSDYTRIAISLFGQKDEPAGSIGAIQRVKNIEDASTCDNAFGFEQQYQAVRPRDFFSIKYLSDKVFCSAGFNVTAMLASPVVREHLLHGGFPNATSSRKDAIAMEWCLKAMTSDHRPAEEAAAEGPTREQLQACIGPLFSQPRKTDVVKPMHRMVPFDAILSFLDYDINVEFAEAYIPMHQAVEVTRLLEQWTTSEGFSATKDFLVFELYSTKQQPFWNAPSFTGPMLRIGQFVWTSHGTDHHAHFKRLWDFLAEHGVRFGFHWGKYGPVRRARSPTPDRHDAQDALYHCDPKYVAMQHAMTPNWSRFMSLIDRYDPKGVFRTGYWSKYLQCDVISS